MNNIERVNYLINVLYSNFDRKKKETLLDSTLNGHRVENLNDLELEETIHLEADLLFGE